jgi:hypothetical protein
MAQKAQWSTVEGGVSNTFPLSINRTSHWTALRRGECYFQDMTDWESIGALSYVPTPKKSPQCFIKKFEQFVFNPNTDVVEFYAYGRYWKVNPNNRTEMLFSEITFGGDSEYLEDSIISFLDDGEDPIRLVAPDGNGRMYVLKNNAGYLLEGLNGDLVSWQKSAPNFGVGTTLTTTSYTNAVYNGRILTVWDAGEEGVNRHYVWDGDDVVELSEDIRELTDADSSVTSGLVNWAKNLLIFGKFVYDLNNKRVFYYSGEEAATFTSRPYFQSNYSPISLYRMAFITDGQTGSFTAQIEYGQSKDNLQKTKEFNVVISPTSRKRIRHIWNLDMPVLCRIWRLKITGLTGCSISQVDVYASVESDPDRSDGTE